MTQGTLIGIVFLILLLECGCVTINKDPAVGCWESNPGGEGLAMRFDAGGKYYFPIETGKPDGSGGRWILINQNSKGSWERINETSIKVNYQNKNLMTGEDVLIDDIVQFDKSNNSAYFESTGPEKGEFYKTNMTCN